MKRSLTQKTVNPNRSTSVKSQPDVVASKVDAGHQIRRTGAKALSLAALSVGATASILMPMPGEDALAAESAISQPLVQHRVQDGDTIWGLSESYGVPAEAIAVSNAIEQGEVLAVGQTIQIPVPGESSATEQASAPETLREETEIVLDTSFEEPQIVAAAAPEAEFSSVEEVVFSPEPLVVDTEPDEMLVSEEPQIIAAESNEIEEAVAETMATETGFEETIAVESSPSILEPTLISEQQQPEVLSTPQAVPSVVTLQPESPAEPSITLAANPVSRATHQIAPGETLQVLADRYRITLDDLLALNRGIEPTRLQVGQTIVVPEQTLAQQTQQPIAQVQRPQVQPSLSTQGAPGANDAHIQRLKADVMRMRAEIRANRQRMAAQEAEELTTAPTQRAVAPTPSVSAPTPGTVVEVPIHPEWARQRLSPPSRILDAPDESLVAAAPSPARGYNRLLRLPAGQSVEPQVPPLLEQEQYLPDSPQVFDGYVWPARGTLTSGYGPRWGRMHRGIDIAAPTGTPIHAAASGEVVSSGWNSGGYGNLVEIRHPDGSLTRYAHNSRLLVRKGDRVEQGQRIALMGSTGYSTGPHLHFELHPSGKGAANPMAFLPKNRN